MARKKQSTTWSLHESLILIAFGFSLINLCAASLVNKTSSQEVCTTPECIKAAWFVLKNMNKTTNPCDDFYQFACGKFIKETVIPEERSNVALWTKMTDLLQDKLKQTIEGKLEDDDPRTFKILKSYYNVCLNTDKIEKTSTKEVNDILNKLGNWPVVVGKSWSESNFDWKKCIYQLRKIGYMDSAKSIINFDISRDIKNTTRYIIYLAQATTGIANVYLSKGIEEKVVQVYYKYMVELATILGANRKEAEKELTESLHFEIGLANISSAPEKRRNISQMHNIKTVKQLQSEYPGIPWIEYLNGIVSPQSSVDLTDDVVVIDPSFFKSLSQLIAKTPKRVLGNYLVWRVIRESTKQMNEKVRKIEAEFNAAITGTHVEKPRWAQCIDYVSEDLPIAIGALYVRKNFDKKTKSDVQELVNKLRESFEAMLKKVDWMDEETKIAAQTKLNSTKTNVAYPDEFFDNQELDKYFENLQVDEESFLKSRLQSKVFNLEYDLKQLQKPVDKHDWHIEWIGSVITAYSFYNPIDNTIQIPAAILQGEYFTTSRPNYMNYGAIGWTIGHLFTNGFDDKGSQFDKDGNLANWWKIGSQKEYLKRTQCFIDQYSNYTVKEVGLNINGKNTQGKNIADNGGIKEAYYAYKEFERQKGKEPRLPGLPYTPRQMFWISAANAMCTKFRPEDLKNHVITNEQTPGEFRVIGSLSNMLEFALDFKCRVGSPMNPVKKCTMW